METSKPKPFQKKDDDWVCPDPGCGNINFGWRTNCNKCNMDKESNCSSSSSSKKKLGHEIGKVIAEKSKGLFSPEDWQCNKCGNVNWARRNQCNMCNAPKFGEVEERTGLGGGYNERGVVEYKRRDDSDDEYDEFGRRKKKNYGSSIHSEDSYQGGIVNRNQSKEEGEEEDGEEGEEEEDEEEEDDDGDLSKYDLSGWGDEEAGEKKEENKEDREERHNKNNSRSSRSRSRSPIERK